MPEPDLSFLVWLSASAGLDLAPAAPREPVVSRWRCARARRARKREDHTDLGTGCTPGCERSRVMALKLPSPGMVIYLLVSIVPDAFIGTPFEPSMQASLDLCDRVSSTDGSNRAPLLV